MTFETRVQRAVQGARRAVEVMEMSTFTDQQQPGTVERFDRFKDRKQRNRRIGALVVAGALAVAAIVILSTDRFGGSQEVVPLAPTAPEGTVLFKVFDGIDSEMLFVLDVSNGEIVDLGVDSDPGATWSRDGTRILVTSTASPEPIGGMLRPATVAADGSDFRLLDGATEELNISCSAFSPDGSMLACLGYDGTGEGSVYTARASDGGGLELLSELDGIPGDFSPDGDEIVFFAQDRLTPDEGGTLYVVGTDGTGIRQITPPGSVACCEASWSPDGVWITYAGMDGELMLVHPDGGDRHRLPIEPGGGLDAVRAPGWSPDGRWIAFSGYGTGAETTDLYLVRLDGSGLTQLTETPDTSEWGSDWS